MEPLCDLFDASLTELLNTDTLVFNQNVKGNNNGYTVNQLSEKLIDQYEARIAEKDGIKDGIIEELKERLKKESRIP